MRSLPPLRILCCASPLRTAARVAPLAHHVIVLPAQRSFDTSRYGPRLLHFAKELIDLAPGAFTSSELCALLRAAHAVQGRGDYDDAELVALRTTLAERLAMAAVLLW